MKIKLDKNDLNLSIIKGVYSFRLGKDITGNGFKTQKEALRVAEQLLSNLVQRRYLN